ncbi:MAG: IPT/TIG domain-containing protein, partial [Acidimicrobiales bacterium]
MSGKTTTIKIVLAALLSLVGLSVVDVGQAYGAAPTVTSVSPSSGSANGSLIDGTDVTVIGTGFGTLAENVTSIKFNGVSASFASGSGSGSSATQIKSVVVPPAATSTAAVNVQVTTTGGTATGTDVYTYTWTAAPTVTAVGQEAVTATSQVGSVVTVTAAGTWTAGQDVSLAGFVNNLTSGVVPVVTGGTGSFTIHFAGTMNGGLPSNGVVSPTPAGAVGTTAGGTSVVIIGTNLGGPSAVHFGSTAATSFTVVSGTELTAVAPAGAVGPVDVSVTTPDATSATSASGSDTYSYVTTPTVTGVTTVSNPAGGPTGGGTQVTITGT